VYTQYIVMSRYSEKSVETRSNSTSTLVSAQAKKPTQMRHLVTDNILFDHKISKERT